MQDLSADLFGVKYSSLAPPLTLLGVRRAHRFGTALPRDARVSSAIEVVSNQGSNTAVFNSVFLSIVNLSRLYVRRKKKEEENCAFPSPLYTDR